MLVLGETIYNGCDFCHVGDGVLATCDDPAVATEVVRAAMESQLRFQKNKQGFGTYCAEFLRVCFNDAASVGYYARSAASMVSGSWTSIINWG